MNISYLRDTAEQAGLRTHPTAIDDIGWEEKKSRSVDLDRRPTETIFKLYPWEWMLAERFGASAPQNGHGQKRTLSSGSSQSGRCWGRTRPTSTASAT